MFVDVGIQQAMLMRHIAICGLSDSTIFSPHYLTKDTIFGKMLLNLKCVLIVSTSVLFFKDN